MRAAVLECFNEPLHVTDVPDPTIEHANEVVIRVRACGLCGTDLKINAGALDTVTVPIIPGHEIAGEIAFGTDRLAVGQRVACYHYTPCGQCSWCRRGQLSLCPHSRRLGFEQNGGLAEYVRVAAVNALPFGDQLSFEEAAVTMDAVTSPWRALMVRAALAEGETLVVVGAGGLGLNAVQIGLAKGAHVAVVDPVEGLRNLAKEMGAEIAVRSDESAVIVDWSEGGVDVGFEGSGTRNGFDMAVACLRPGGRLACCGYRPGTDFAIDSAKLALQELSILGSRAGAREDARAALRAVEGRIVRPKIANTLPLSEVNDALDRLRRSETLGRLVIHPGD